MTGELSLLWRLTLGGTAAALVLLLLRPLLRRYGGAEVMYAAWLGVPAAMVVKLALPLLPQWPWAKPLLPRGLTWRVEAAPASAAEVAFQASGAWPAPGELVLPAWGLGALLLGLALLRSHARWVALRRLPAGASPALCGVWRPRLLLPADFRQRYDRSQRHLMLLHERVHAERGDTRWLLLAQAVLVLQWFNPVAWWALARMRADMEMACDAAVLRRVPHQRARYRDTLIAGQGMRPAWSLTACSGHPLIERISMLKRPLHHSRRWLASLLIAGMAVGSWAASGEPGASPAINPDDVRLVVDLQLGGTSFSPVAMITPPGKPAILRMDNDHGLKVRLEVLPEALADGRYKLKVHLHEESSGLDVRPAIVTREGVAARIESSRSDRNWPAIGIDITARRVGASPMRHTEAQVPSTR